MAKAKFVPDNQAAASKARKTVDPQAVMSRAIAGYKSGEEKQEPEVEVNVPKAFKLTDDGHIMHNYSVGRQKMPKSHAEHFYSIANGVTIL